ncbi:MAG: T9SS type A sorting domain-containing protein [Planctomycetes bacterium]|nr:T9SS type A sorting domain-containing protein [Planctomycetota bacterium]
MIGLENAQVISIAIAPNNDDAIYACCYSGLYKTTDGGGIWEHVFDDQVIQDIVVHPINADIVYATWGLGVLKTTNGGQSWDDMSEGIIIPIMGYAQHIAIDPNDPETVYMETFSNYANGSIFKTTNGGLEWVDVGDGILIVGNRTDIIVNPGNSQEVLVSQNWTSYGLVKTTNGGSDWYMPEIANWEIGAMVIDPSDYSRAYAISQTSPGFLHLSQDSGDTWEVISMIANGIVTQLVIDPTNSANMYASCDYGVYRSTNFGLGWSFINLGLNDPRTNCLAISSNGAYLYAGNQMGVYRAMINPVAIADEAVDLTPGVLHLQSYPNPFRQITNICYNLPEMSSVILNVYDLAGRRVRTLVNTHQPIGRHAVTWDGTDENGHPMSCGAYFFRLQTDMGIETGKLILLR